MQKPNLLPVSFEYLVFCTHYECSLLFCFLQTGLCENHWKNSFKKSLAIFPVLLNIWFWNFEFSSYFQLCVQSQCLLSLLETRSIRFRRVDILTHLSPENFLSSITWQCTCVYYLLRLSFVRFEMLIIAIHFGVSINTLID